VSRRRGERSKCSAIISFCFMLGPFSALCGGHLLMRPPELDRVGEGARLFADHLELAVFSAYLKAVHGMPALRRARFEHRLIEQRRVAEARRAEDHAFGAARSHALDQVAPFCRLSRSGRDSACALRYALARAASGSPLGRHVGPDEARAARQSSSTM
jgi:hypothetical protein